MGKNRVALHGRLEKLFPKSSHWLALPVAAFALSGCVTINIYFPAAAAEKAADKIIDEVWQIKKNSTEPSNKSDVPGDKANEPAVKGAK